MRVKSALVTQSESVRHHFQPTAVELVEHCQVHVSDQHVGRILQLHGTLVLLPFPEGNHVWSISRRVDRSTYRSGITQKMPRLFDGSTSWFKYEELIDDCFDFTVLEKEKRSPTLKDRLVGDAEMHKGLLDRESLRAADGVKYFRDTLRPHFIKGAQSVFHWRIYQVTRARRGNIEMVK